jgi:hypothetical protein
MMAFAMIGAGFAIEPHRLFPYPILCRGGFETRPYVMHSAIFSFTPSKLSVCMLSFSMSYIEEFCVIFKNKKLIIWRQYV